VKEEEDRKNKGFKERFPVRRMRFQKKGEDGKYPNSMRQASPKSWGISGKKQA